MSLYILLPGDSVQKLGPAHTKVDNQSAPDKKSSILIKIGYFEVAGPADNCVHSRVCPAVHIPCRPDCKI